MCVQTFKVILRFKLTLSNLALCLHWIEILQVSILTRVEKLVIRRHFSAINWPNILKSPRRISILLYILIGIHTECCFLHPFYKVFGYGVGSLLYFLISGLYAENYGQLLYFRILSEYGDIRNRKGYYLQNPHSVIDPTKSPIFILNKYISYLSI